jgi:dihydropteroate synthase
MQENPDYHDVVGEVVGFLIEQRAACLAAGIAPQAVVFDPGLGFGKRHEDNLALLKHLGHLAALGSPLLVGVSRKSTIGRVLGRAPLERLAGGLGLAAWAVGCGARIVRTHDVAATRDAIMMVDAVLEGRGS